MLIIGDGLMVGTEKHSMVMYCSRNDDLEV